MLTKDQLYDLICCKIAYLYGADEYLQPGEFETLRALFSEYEMASIPVSEQRAGGPA